jgi:predicted acyl esterase
MHTYGDRAACDRPWRRPGRARYAWRRLRAAVRPPVTVYEPAPGTVVVERDQPVVTRDGTVLRVNVHRPPGDGRFATVLCAHPYGKDKVPVRTRRGDYRVPLQYRMLRQPASISFSTLTTWEAPDPAWWVGQGYAVVNCDLRGAGTSDGVGALLSDQEGEDIYDLVEWAGAQTWSTGAVGMLGVSYLALSQWKVAAQRPPSLRAIVPWEGFTDAYRGLVRPGGFPEVGFLKVWNAGMKRTRQAYSLLEECERRPLVDDWWRSLVPDLVKIEVPALICGSFSDNNLHSRGSISGFELISSTERYLYTHRGGKWATFYDDEARAAQLQFFDRHLRGRSTPPLPMIRLEVREAGDRVAEVRDETAWPLERTRWTPMYLTAEGLAEQPPDEPDSISFKIRSSGVRFGWTVPADIELTGPMALRVFVEVAATDDVDLVAGLEKWHGHRYVGFEGSYGFGRDRITTGWQAASLRTLDPGRSRPFQPVPAFTTRQPLRPGEIVPVDIALGPSATVFRAAEQLRLVIAGRWLWPRNPFTGQFPAAYRTHHRGTCTLHWGPDRHSHILLPVTPDARPPRRSPQHRPSSELDPAIEDAAGRVTPRRLRTPLD